MVSCIIFSVCVCRLLVDSSKILHLYVDAIDHYDGGTRQVMGPKGTAKIFATYPKEFVSNMTGFWDQVSQNTYAYRWTYK